MVKVCVCESLWIYDLQIVSKSSMWIYVSANVQTDVSCCAEYQQIVFDYCCIKTHVSLTSNIFEVI